MAKRQAARQMKAEKYGLTKYEKVIQYYREHPVAAAKDLLGIDLIWFQRYQLKELWYKPYCLMKWGRGCSKTFTVAIYSVLRAMLYPDSNIGIVGPSYRQTQYVFDEIDTLFAKSVYFRASTVNNIIKRTTESCLARFHNGSRIEGLPIGTDGSKIRGRRYTIVVLDEFSYHNEETIRLVVEPFLVVKKGPIPNQIIMCSTPSYKTNHFYTQYLHFLEQSIKDPTLYSCTSFNFVDVLMAKNKVYQMDMNIVLKAYNNNPIDEFLMEYGGYFPAEGMGFFSGPLLARCEPRTAGEAVEMELFGDPNSEYVMGIDPAREKDGANFAIVLMKMLPGNIRQVVRVVTAKDLPIPEQANLIREQVFARGFNCVKICMDYGGGGRAVEDLLMSQWTHQGKVYPGIISTERLLDKNNWDSSRVMPVLEMVNFNVPLIDYMYSTLKGDMEHKKVLFPMTIRRDLDPHIEAHGKEFAFLKSEMLHITPKPSTKGLTFEENKKLGKDRITALVLANYGANLIYRDEAGGPYQPKHNIPMGGWV